MSYFIAATQGLDVPSASPRSGVPMVVLPESLSPRAWGVDMERATRQARYALESL